MPRRTLRHGVAVGIVLLLAACTADLAEPPRAQETGSAEHRLELSAKPLWRGDMGGLPDIMRTGFASARFVGPLLILELDRSRIAVVNPDDGRPVWTADPRLRVGETAKGVELHVATGRAPVAEVAGEKVLFAGYDAGDEPSVAALRLRDAGVLWTVPGSYGVADADDHLVVLTGEGPVARALDAATGATRWVAQSVWPRFVAGDRVLAEVSSRAPDQDATDSAVVGLDAASGQQVWSLADRYARSAVAFVAGDVALVYARLDADTARDAVVVIDSSSGAEITRLGWDWGARTTCATDDDATIACTLDQDLGQYPGMSARLATFDVRTMKSHSAPTEHLDDAEVSAVWGDYVLVHAGQDTWAVDRDGTRVSDNLPGVPIGIDDHHVVVRLPGPALTPAAYTLR